MSDAITYYVVLPILRNEEGELVAGDGIEAPSAAAAVRRAEAMAQGKAGAVAFSRTGNPSLGEFDDAVVLASYGAVPTDVAELMR